MVKRIVCSVLVVSALATCASAPPGPYPVSPCVTNPGGYHCQIERYQRAPG